GLAKAHGAATAATLHLPDEEEPDADDDDEGQPTGEQDRPERARFRCAGSDADAAVFEAGDHVSASGHDGFKAAAVVEHARHHIIGDGNAAHSAGIHLGDEL